MKQDWGKAQASDMSIAYLIIKMAERHQDK